MTTMRTHAELTPWFLGSEHAPMREGRYQVRFCIGWREVFCNWRRGAWWVGCGPDKPQRVNMRRWPGFHWRGLSGPPNVALSRHARQERNDDQ